MELRMLKEENEREKARAHNVALSAESNSAQLLSERDEMNAKINDLRLQLAAALADVEVARSDAERIMMANGNLQAALEAFQAEREAEVAMIENNQREQEKALVAAHAVALEATRETHRVEIRQIQEAADAAVKNSMDEIKLLEEKIEMMRIENVQTRRSLDEAIKRLQATQDDVVDRTFMKNILLDWLTETEKKERGQVLELMASVLHFTDDEKQRVHIDDGGGIRKFVAPPPPKADMEHLEGDNVREKWVNFLMAETED
jgi:flagellin-like hook-associated protein FlgL